MREHVSEALVGSSNDDTFRQLLSPKIKARLMQTEISFSPHDAGELKTILRHRMERAIIDGVCDQSAIAKAAALAAQDMGNA